MVGQGTPCCSSYATHSKHHAKKGMKERLYFGKDFVSQLISKHWILHTFGYDCIQNPSFYLSMLMRSAVWVNYLHWRLSALVPNIQSCLSTLHQVSKHCSDLIGLGRAGLVIHALHSQPKKTRSHSGLNQLGLFQLSYMAFSPVHARCCNGSSYSTETRVG